MVATPNSYRLSQFAFPFLNQRMRPTVVGDSINADGSTGRMPYGWIRKANPARWAGFSSYGFNYGNNGPVVFNKPSDFGQVCTTIATGTITSGPFQVGETVTESVSLATAKTIRYDNGENLIYLNPLTGTLTGGQVLTGGTSGAHTPGGTRVIGPVNPLSGFGAVLTAEGGDPSGGAAENASWPTIYGDSGIFKADIADFTAMYNGQFDASTMAAFGGGAWFGGTGSKCRVGLYSGAACGLSPIGYDGFLNQAPNTQTDVQNSIALVTGSNFVDINLNVGLGLPAKWEVFAAHGSAPNETGKNLYCQGTRWYNSLIQGLEMSFACKGGATVAMHIDTTRVSNQAITDWVNLYETDSIIIWLGQNDTPTYDGTWITNLIALIQRWRAAVQAAGRSFKCLLISPYDTGSATLANIATDMYTVAATYSDVSFLNLYALAGPFATIDSLYLGDHVHPNADGSGANYFIGKVNQQMVEGVGGHTPRMRTGSSRRGLGPR